MPLPLPTEKAASAGTVTVQESVSGEASGIGKDFGTATIRQQGDSATQESSVSIGMMYNTAATLTFRSADRSML